MKKKLFIVMICQVLAMVGVHAATRSAILRLHNGTGITYETAQLAQAVAEAESGDTLCLNEGIYNLSEELVIDKAVTLMGAGQSTQIIGNISIAIEGEPTLTSRMFDAVKIMGSVSVSKNLKGLSFRKVSISDNLSWQVAISDVLADRCNLKNLPMNSNLRSANFVNCRIQNLYFGDSNNNCEITFLNCSIFDWHIERYLDQRYATYINCIVMGVSINGTNYCTNYSTLYNSLVLLQSSISGTNTIANNCYVFDGRDGNAENYTTMTKEELIAAGYLGNDGTVVGVEGGNTPYTLVPNSITVTESQLKVDNANKTLNVTLKVASN